MRQSIFTAVLCVFTLAAVAMAEDQLTLTSGEIIRGTIVNKADGVVTLKHPIMGQVTIPMEKIKAMAVVEPAAPVPAAEPAKPAEPAAPVPPPPPAPKPTDWKFHIEAGFSGSEGNTQDANVYLRAAGKREIEKVERTNIFARYFLSSKNGDRNENKATAGVTQDWFIDQSPWFVFADGTADYDEFQSWEYRVSGHGGAGYQFIKNEKFDLSGRVGMGAIKEFNSPDESVRPEALAGIDFLWNLTKAQSITFSNYVYPDLGEVGEFRNVTEAAWQIKIDQNDGLSLKLGLLNEYESNAPAGTKKNDLKYFGALVYDF
ncbi:MAG: DUF481 domain-containing protein [Planctomycetes bacterium]|nr:DUF481 domain-containing protein [Planctomycetota bacterium]